MAPAASPRPIHIFHHTFRRAGGKERYAIALAAALKQLDFPVVCHAMKGDQEIAQSLGVDLRLLQVPGIPRRLQSFRFFRQVEKVRHQVEGLQITLSRTRARDVLISGGTHRGYLERARKWIGPLDLLEIWMERQAYQAPRLIVAHSDLLAADLSTKYQVPNHRLRTLYAPVDERFHALSNLPPRPEIRRRFGWPEDRTVFLFPSMGHGRKGFQAIRQALGYFPDRVLLAVAGKPAPGDWPFVKCMGYIEDMAAAYRSADFTILASNYEPFGLVGPESILCGTRVVFEENIGCLPAIKPENVLSFSVWDPVSVREAVSRALSLAASGKHRIDRPLQGLTYDPMPIAHARSILEAIEAGSPNQPRG